MSLLKILYIVAHNPFGEQFGSQLRTLQIGRMLQKIGNVTMVLVSVADEEEDAIRKSRSEFNLQITAKVLPDPVKGIVERIKHEFDPYYCKTHGNSISNEDIEKILELSSSHDITWIHTLRVANYFRKSYWKDTILDVDDFYSQYHATEARQAVNPLKKILSLRRSWLWKRREKVLANRFNVFAICSEDDRRLLPSQCKVHVVPNGFQDPQPVPKEDTLNRIGVVGRLDYMPNCEGVEWFIDEVWPSIRQTNPNAEFRIVGAGANVAWQEIPGVSILGYVDDTAKEIASWAAMIVPLHVGAGTRVKIAEAFARSCPVISTSVGAFGYDVLNDQELIIANKPSDFSTACIRLLSSSVDREFFSKAGRSYFLKNLHWVALLPNVEAAINDVLSLRDNDE